MNRQSAQISEWEWCYWGSRDSLECLRFLLQAQVQNDLLLAEKYQFAPLLPLCRLSSGLADT